MNYPSMDPKLPKPWEMDEPDGGIMDEYKIVIKVCDNGFILESPEDVVVFDNGDESLKRNDYKPATLKMVQHLLYTELGDEFIGNKWASERITVGLEEGRHFCQPGEGI